MDDIRTPLREAIMDYETYIEGTKIEGSNVSRSHWQQREALIEKILQHFKESNDLRKGQRRVSGIEAVKIIGHHGELKAGYIERDSKDRIIHVCTERRVEKERRTYLLKKLRGIKE